VWGPPPGSGARWIRQCIGRGSLKGLVFNCRGAPQLKDIAKDDQLQVHGAVAPASLPGDVLSAELELCDISPELRHAWYWSQAANESRAHPSRQKMPVADSDKKFIADRPRRLAFQGAFLDYGVPGLDVLIHQGVDGHLLVPNRLSPWMPLHSRPRGVGCGFGAWGGRFFCQNRSLEPLFVLPFFLPFRACASCLFRLRHVNFPSL